jgi:ABC-type glutathione transport system ATPase component
MLKISDRLLAMRDGRIVEQVENMEGFAPTPQGAISDLVQAILPATPTAVMPCERLKKLNKRRTGT